MGIGPFVEKGKDCKLLLLTLRQSDHRSGFKRAAFWCPRLRPVSIHVPQSALIEFQGPDVAGEVAKGPTVAGADIEQPDRARARILP